MSYLVARDLSNLRVDLFTPQSHATGTANTPWTLTAPSKLFTDVTAGTTSITLYSGSSYYLEGAPQADNTNSGVRGDVSWQFYDVTNSQWIGSDAYIYTAGNSGASARQGRKACTALILDSDISTSMVIELRIKTITGTNWNFVITGPDFGMPSSVYGHTGYPSIRVWQLPS